mgnify:CR=1 FL=1
MLMLMLLLCSLKTGDISLLTLYKPSFSKVHAMFMKDRRKEPYSSQTDAHPLFMKDRIHELTNPSLKKRGGIIITDPDAMLLLMLMLCSFKTGNMSKRTLNKPSSC